jgi:hypothetical protein
MMIILTMLYRLMFMLQHLQQQVDAVIQTIHMQEDCRASCCHVQLIHDNNIIYADESIK